MSSKSRNKEKTDARVKDLWKQLMGRYQVFRQYRTMEVGVKPKLIEAIHRSELFREKSVYVIEKFLRKYTHSEYYLKNALKYKTRFNLEGDEVGKVSDKDVAYFDEELKGLIKRRSDNAQSKIAEELERELKYKARLNKSRPILSLHKKPTAQEQPGSSPL